MFYWVDFYFFFCLLVCFSQSKEQKNIIKSLWEHQRYSAKNLSKLWNKDWNIHLQKPASTNSFISSVTALLTPKYDDIVWLMHAVSVFILLPYVVFYSFTFVFFLYCHLWVLVLCLLFFLFFSFFLPFLLLSLLLHHYLLQWGQIKFYFNFKRERNSTGLLSVYTGLSHWTIYYSRLCVYSLPECKLNKIVVFWNIEYL